MIAINPLSEGMQWKPIPAEDSFYDEMVQEITGHDRKEYIRAKICPFCNCAITLNSFTKTTDPDKALKEFHISGACVKCQAAQGSITENGANNGVACGGDTFRASGEIPKSRGRY